ncbi:efflux RND transporter periplasmic adaptor subunit [Pseudomonas donghuensis]|uniref:Efflux RND transporter periplasmic adaptor subunit n=1 Tax=Pseudomonas donghuensis TaxID=1163398 RepID=A0AAP0SGD3_9PSED|nr:efflux RND transporter periplasmic adaptor subunit [Pseudomonas donghuensis]MDF9895048.1 cobalt-zinc-cadmium efflux system membrane fusion protein [Pseudomonas vranovensis]KDN97610.1 efflux RND transporter periplasmic adaptor subunit [Pseudomonas donghuensis]MCP6690577.1 efflux RND transporter periplasmic adaptor subunit [Pseudomonas donghuensis]UVL23326.1 efflux RND transporter periplasmic adaptor subunit [Pseudomonas donghuensis]UVL28468.1 efflux RND transporter periplasmic adaptor subuni
MNKKSTTLLVAALLLGLGLGVLLARQGGPVAAAPASAHAHTEGDHEEEQHGESEKTEDGHEEEGALTLSQEQIDLAGIELAAVGPRQLQRSLSLPGEIRFDEDRTAHLVPRAAGVVESVAVVLGQQVKAGDLLAVIASPQISEQRSELAASQRRLELARSSYQREKDLWQEGISAEQDYQQARQALQEAEIAQANARQKISALSGSVVLAGGNRYELRAPFAGQIVEKHLVPGEVVNETSAAFTLSDLSRVWASFGVAPRDLPKVRAGMPVTLVASELGEQVSGTVTHVGSLLGEQTRTATVRVTLDNPRGAWRPGLFVAVQVPTEQYTAALSVPDQALQTLEEKPTVFVRSAAGFIAQTVEPGASANGFVEIRKGLQAGQQVAAQGSFILKSELGKASAEHAH